MYIYSLFVTGKMTRYTIPEELFNEIKKQWRRTKPLIGEFFLDTFTSSSVVLYPEKNGFPKDDKYYGRGPISFFRVRRPKKSSAKFRIASEKFAIVSSNVDIQERIIKIPPHIQLAIKMGARKL